MAKTTAPLFSASASGTIGRVLTMCTTRGQHLAKRKNTPSKTQSAAQIARRQLYSSAAELWRRLPPAAKAAWSAEALRDGITPYNAYIREVLTLGALPVGTLWDNGGTTYDTPKTYWDF